MEFKPATCPNCAGELQVPANMVNANCIYCGSAFIVREAAQGTALANLSTCLKLANVAASAGNFVEAYTYFSKILEVDPQSHEAWFGKGEAAGWMSSPEKNRLGEMLTLFQEAVKSSPPEVRPRMVARTNDAIAVITLNAYRKACKDVAEQSEEEHDAQIADCLYMVSLIEQTHKYDPQDRQIVEGLIWICQDILDGEHYPVTQRVPFSEKDETEVVMKTLRLSYEQKKALRQRIAFYEYVWKQLQVV